MNQEASPPAPKTIAASGKLRRKIRLWRWLFFGAASLLLLAALTLAGFCWRAYRSIDTELDRVRSVGEPTSTEELDQFYQRPAANNDNTELWLAAFKTMDEIGLSSSDIPLAFFESRITLPAKSWEDFEAVEKLLQKGAAALARLHEAADAPGLTRYPISFQDGMAAEIPKHFAGIRLGASLLKLEAFSYMRQGNCQEAIRSVHAIFMLGRSLEREPNLYSQLTRMGVNIHARWALAELMSRFDLSAEQLEVFKADVQRTGGRDGMRLATIGERVSYIELFQHPESVNTDVSARWFRIKSCEGFSYCLQVCRHLIALLESDENYEKVKPFMDRDDELENGKTSTLRFLRDNVYKTFNVNQFSMRSSAFREEIRRDAALTAIAVEQYRLENGRRPNSLTDLVPKFLTDVPDDPDVRLMYVVTPEKFHIRAPAFHGDESFDPKVHRSSSDIQEAETFFQETYDVEYGVFRVWERDRTAKSSEK